MAELDDIIATVARIWHVTPADIYSRTRVREAVRARQHTMYELCVRGHSLADIGRMLDRDHTTVLHGVRAHAGRYGLPVPTGRPGGQPGRRLRGEVPAGPVRGHLAMLQAAGLTAAAVAEAAGVAPSTVSRLRAGRQGSLRRDAADRLLAVTVRGRPEPAVVSPVVPSCEVCGTASLGGGRWCGVGRCASSRGRWSWSRTEAA